MPRVIQGITALLAVVAAAAPVSAQGWIEGPRLPGGAFAVEKVESDVRVRVVGGVAEVEVTEWFLNGGSRLAEGDYLYPLPGEAVFDGFSLFQGDAELRGEIMDAAAARAIYEEIVRRRADPALIELAGEGLLRARIFPIAPGEKRKVTLRYTQVLKRAGRSLQFVYAGAQRAGADQRHDGAPEGRAPAESLETDFQLVVDAGADFLDPFSPTHTLSVSRSTGRLVVRAHDEITGRMSVFLPLAGEDVGLSVATHRPPGEDGYVMLTLSPGLGDGRVQPRDVTVVLDVSGSMSGEKIGQAQAAVRGLLRTLGPDDRFRLVAFSNAVRMESDAWRPGTPAALETARAWVDGLRADGGTDIGAALDEAFRLESGAERLPVVIFLTDGLPSVGEQSPQRLADRAEAGVGRRRIFAFGVGHDVNTHLLDRLGEAGRGSTDYVEPGENVERAVGLVTSRIQYPVLTELTLGPAPVRLTEIFPVDLPDVFAGEALVLFGRYEGQGSGSVTLRGVRSNGARAYSADAAFRRTEAANAWIPRLWASRKLGHLMRQLWTEGETESLVEEIKEVALRYGLPSKYTSYLVEEPEVVARRTVDPAAGTGWAASASGAGAVRQAREAARFRDADDLRGLRDAERTMADRAEAPAPGASAPRRMLAGRLFIEESGVWVDQTTPSGDVVDIRVFSPAYFRIMEALPELRPAFRELEQVRIAGRAVDLRMGPDGVEHLTHGEVEALVLRFRGPGGTQ